MNPLHVTCRLGIAMSFCSLQEGEIVDKTTKTLAGYRCVGGEGH